MTSGDIVTEYPYHHLHAVGETQQRGDADAHLVLVENPSFRLRGDMGLTNGRIDPDATPRMTYANIGVFSPRLFAGVASVLQGGRAPLFPWLYEAARAGRVSGEIYRGRWWNSGTPHDLAQVDADLTRVSNQAASGQAR